MMSIQETSTELQLLDGVDGALCPHYTAHEQAAASDWLHPLIKLAFGAGDAESVGLLYKLAKLMLCDSDDDSTTYNLDTLFGMVAREHGLRWPGAGEHVQ